MSKQAFGWLVEVSGAAGRGAAGATRRYAVAEPNRLEAMATVRRRVSCGAGATVEAVEGLSRNKIYTTLRLKRGDLIEIGGTAAR